jgi:hypothetical protein
MEMGKGNVKDLTGKGKKQMESIKIQIYTVTPYGD